MNKIGRRTFLGTSAAAAAARTLNADDAIEAAVRKVGQLPRHKLGSGREISALVGSYSWNAAAVEAGVRCGVNFWHKVDEWSAEEFPKAILKNRDAHYCQVSVDRIHGNHEVGQIDEESHYRYVKDALRRTGLKYFDDMQFHFGYHNVAEITSNRGVVRAFERLKKEGVVKHLCLSQHSYNGNSRVKGGQSAAEILTAVVADGVYEHAQFIFSYQDEPAINEWVALARRKGFGTIAMKTSRGVGRMSRDQAFTKGLPVGVTPYHLLARWLTTRSGLDSAVIAIHSVDEFADTFSGAGKQLRTADERALGRMAAYADREACRLCNACMEHCERGVPVADIFRYERYALDYRRPGYARKLYAELETRADSCRACGECSAHCPQSLAISEKLARVHGLLA
jgi:uncharacterized protein